MVEQKPLLFTLFRVQAHFPEQMTLLGDLTTPADIIRAALLEKPSDGAHGASWRIGNVTELPPNGLYFAIGKEQPKNIGSVDGLGDFHNQATIVAPNTHAVIDLGYQVIAIANNAELSSAPKAVANKLQKLMQATDVVRNHSTKITIELITDPTDFVEILAAAEAVTKFQVTYGLPNVWDVEQDFQKPMQDTSRAMGADQATATFSGEDLDRDNLIKLARASSAVGKRSKAWVKRSKKQKPVPVSQKENPVTLSAERPEESQPVRWGKEIVKLIRELYKSVRLGD
jgi:hypothetical protein